MASAMGSIRIFFSKSLGASPTFSSSAQYQPNITKRERTILKRTRDEEDTSRSDRLQQPETKKRKTQLGESGGIYLSSEQQMRDALSSPKLVQLRFKGSTQRVERKLPTWFPRDKKIYHGIFIPSHDQETHWLAPRHSLHGFPAVLQHEDTLSQFQEMSITLESLIEDFKFLMCFKPATEFTIFSQLPIEIRLMIWNAALPTSKLKNGSLVYSMVCYPVYWKGGIEEPIRTIEPHLGYTGTRAGRWTIFKEIQIESEAGVTTTNWLSMAHNPLNGQWTSEEAFDIGVSGACSESRKVYLKRFKYQLAESRWSDRVVRYDEDATIHIDNAFFLKRWVHDASLRGSMMPDILSNVKYLSVDATILNVTFRNPPGQSYGSFWLRGDGSETICRFQQLKILTIWGVPLTPTNLRMRMCVQLLKIGLQKYKNNINASYEIPRVIWNG